MAKEIKIEPLYNSIVFQVKRTPGDARRTFASGGIYERTIPEGYYMTRKAPKKINPVVKFFRNMYQTMKDIIEATKPDEPEFADTKDILGSIIEM